MERTEVQQELDLRAAFLQWEWIVNTFTSLQAEASAAVRQHLLRKQPSRWCELPGN